MRIAHISRNFSGSFCPTSRALFQGCAVLALLVFGFMRPPELRSLIVVKHRLGQILVQRRLDNIQRRLDNNLRGLSAVFSAAHSTISQEGSVF
jgi:hypothetical protein